jgi:hypothetical protein
MKSDGSDVRVYARLFSVLRFFARARTTAARNTRMVGTPVVP